MEAIFLFYFVLIALVFRAMKNLNNKRDKIDLIFVDELSNQNSHKKEYPPLKLL